MKKETAPPDTPLEASLLDSVVAIYELINAHRETCERVFCRGPQHYEFKVDMCNDFLWYWFMQSIGFIQNQYRKDARLQKIWAEICSIEYADSQIELPDGLVEEAEKAARDYRGFDE